MPILRPCIICLTPCSARRGNNTCSLACRLWKHIDPTPHPHGCWIYTSHGHPVEYPLFRAHGRIQPANRVMWELKHGPIPTGLLLCHNCKGGDNPACINDHHMFLGTPKDNIQDALSKGRMATGDRNGRRTKPEQTAWGIRHGKCKLSEADVLEIRAMTPPIPYKALCERFGIHYTSISAIRHGKNWKRLQ